MRRLGTGWLWRFVIPSHLSWGFSCLSRDLGRSGKLSLKNCTAEWCQTETTLSWICSTLVITTRSMEARIQEITTEWHRKVDHHPVCERNLHKLLLTSGFILVECRMPEIGSRDDKHVYVWQKVATLFVRNVSVASLLITGGGRFSQIWTFLGFWKLEFSVAVQGKRLFLK